MSQVSSRYSAPSRPTNALFPQRRNSSLLASLVSGTDGRQSERRQSRQSVADLEKEFLGITPRPSHGQDSTLEDETPQLSKDELEQMLENCMKLTRDKKITEGRLWGLALPQHMPDLVKHNTDHTNFNFQKVIYGLDAAVQIYSKRVDSLHNAALDTRCRITTNQTEKKERDDDKDVTARRRQKRPSNFDGDTTLASNLDQITTKPNTEDILPIDPLFHKTSALFDVGGFKALPTLNLGLSYGGRYALDTNERPDSVNGDFLTISPTHEISLEVFGVQFEPLLERKPISESSSRLYSMLGTDEFHHDVRDLLLRGMNAVTLQPQEEDPCILEERQPQGAIAIKENLEMDIDGVAEIENAEPEEEEQEEPCHQPGHLSLTQSHSSLCAWSEFPEQGMRFSFELADVLNLPNSTDEVEVLDETTIGWLLDGKYDHGMNRGRLWTGASHWKYPTVKKSSAEEERDVQQKKKVSRHEIDFTNLPETDLVLFKKPAKQSLNNLIFKEDADTLLPTDHKFEASFFLSLGLFPSLKPRQWLCRWRSNSRDVNQDTLPGDDDDGGGLDFDDEYGTDNVNELMEAPDRISEERVDVNLMPIKINMKKLKSDLWSTLDSMRFTDQEQEIPFNAFVHDMMKTEDVSVGLCFACSLHLASEHGFHMINHEPNHQPSVLIPALKTSEQRNQQMETEGNCT